MLLFVFFLFFVLLLLPSASFPPFFPVSLSPLLSLWCFSPSLLLEGTTGGKTPIEGRRRRREQRETTGKKKNNPSHSAFVFACFSFVCFLARFFHPIFAWLTRVVVFQKREGKRPGREGGGREPGGVSQGGTKSQDGREQESRREKKNRDTHTHLPTCPTIHTQHNTAQHTQQARVREREKTEEKPSTSNDLLGLKCLSPAHPFSSSHPPRRPYPSHLFPLSPPPSSLF